MRMQDLSYGMKAAADVARAGEELFGALARTRAHTRFGALLLGVGLGVGIGALIFSPTARARVRSWFEGATRKTETPSAPPPSEEPVDVYAQPFPPTN